MGLLLKQEFGQACSNKGGPTCSFEMHASQFGPNANLGLVWMGLKTQKTSGL